MKILTTLAVAVALCAPAFAQTTGVVGTNDLTINGQGSGGTSPVNNLQIGSTSTELDFVVSAMPNDILIGGFSGGPAAAPLPLSPGYSLDIDLGSLNIWLDGSNPSVGFPISNVVGGSGIWNLVVPVALPNNFPYGFQFAILGAGLPGGLGTTQAHAGTTPAGNVTTYTIADDGFQNHVLTSNSINFYGVPQTAMNIGSNGMITFAAGSNDFTESMPEFFAGWQPSPTAIANPGVAACWSDLNRGGTASGAAYIVSEDTTLQITTVTFASQNHWSSQESAGTWSIIFDQTLASVTFDLSGFTAATTSTDDIILGVTDGDSNLGADADLSDGLGGGFATNIGSYVSAAPGESVGELIPANTLPAAPIFTLLDLGLNGLWSVQ